MQTSRLILGVDGGNTKTIALLARLDGTIVGFGRAGCSDIYGAASPEHALAEIESAVTAALAGSGSSREQICAGGFSLAGADWPEDYAFFQQELAARGLGETIMVVNDAIGALRAGASWGLGIACGTGLAIGARTPQKKIWHGSFWLETHGAREIGRSALRSVFRAELGIAPPTSLTERVLCYFALPTVEAVLHRTTARDRAPYNLGGLAPAVLEEAQAGDAVARHLVCEHGTSIGDYALAVARKVDLTGAFPLVLAGGVFRHPSPLLRNTIVQRIQAEAPEAQPLRTRFEPVVGALLLGFEQAGIELGADRMLRLEESLPAADLFATT